MVQAIDPGSTGLVVLSPPVRPDSPIKPDKFLNLAMALFLGLTLGVLLSLLLEAVTVNRAGESRNRGRELARTWRELLRGQSPP